MKYNFNEQEFKEIVNGSVSIAEVCRKMNIRPVGGNYKTIYSKIKLWNIDISHFTGKGWNIGLKFKPKKPTPLNLILVENSTFTSTYHLQRKLISENIKKEECEICKNSKWLDFPIPLELHHINGINTDHRIENLQILCPNCHALTDTHKGKNKLSALSERRDVEFRKFGESFTANAEPSSL
jgi:hypothetical protein